MDQDEDGIFDNLELVNSLGENLAFTIGHRTSLQPLESLGVGPVLPGSKRFVAPFELKVIFRSRSLFVMCIVGSAYSRAARNRVRVPHSKKKFQPTGSIDSCVVYLSENIGIINVATVSGGERVGGQFP